MHTFVHDITCFNFHSDYSGDIIITRGAAEIQIPFDAIQAFMAEYLRRESVNALEEREDRAASPA